MYLRVKCHLVGGTGRVANFLGVASQSRGSCLVFPSGHLTLRLQIREKNLPLLQTKLSLLPDFSMDKVYSFNITNA